MKRFIACCAVLATGFMGTASAAEPDWSGYAALLQRHLSRHSTQGIELAWVNYSALHRDPDFSTQVALVGDYPRDKLATPAETIAFYTNAYNIMAMKMVLDHWPVQSIKDPGNLFKPVWKQPVGRVAGQETTLHQIEHEILRPMKEPRIHMAIVCASLSCPDLRPEPYTAARLELQLEEQTQRFLNNGSKGARIEGTVVHVSKIFSWFEEDFGPLDKFLRHYRADLPPGVKIETDIPYNWSLNGQ